MNLVRLAPLASVILATGIGCSSGTDDTKKGSGGSPGTGGSAGQAAGAVGGTGGSGGSSGQATTGGTGGSTGGAGGTTAGSAGMSTGGASGMATGGGAGTGTAGMGAGAGGAGAGGMATGGMGGSGAIDSDSFFSPNMNGLYYELRTYNGTDPGGAEYWLTDSATATCPTGADWASSGLTPNPKMFTAKGTAGQKYTVNFQIRGAMALRCISGGTPTEMMGDAMGTKNNSFYAGGTQFMDSPINTWQLDVTPAVTGEAASNYFLNGIPSTSGQCDAKLTYDVGYTAKIVVMGDSTVTLSSHSSDCKVPQNCGADPTGAGGCKPRTIDTTGVEVHASPMQPVADNFDTTMLYPQWVVIDILSITQN